MPVLWEDEEDDSGHDLLAAYGPLAVMLYKRIKEKSLFLTNQDVFLIKLVDFYICNMRGINTTPACYEGAKSLVSVLPSVDKCMRFVKTRRHHRDMVFLKIIIDVLEHFYKQTEAPLFTRYREKVIPLALAFYRSLSNSAIQEMVGELQAATLRSIACGFKLGLEDSGYFLLKRSRLEFVEYYTNEMITYENLVAGNCKDTYYS